MSELSGHFGLKRLFRYTYPSIIMLVFTSIYGVVDGFFISNYAGKTPFAAVNFIMPVLMILGCIGFMFGTGGGALIAKNLGEGEKEKANNTFSLVVFAAALIGTVLAIIGIIFLPQISALFGAEGRLLSDSVLYGRIILITLPFSILQYEFQCLFATSGKPKLGLYVTVAAGVTNMVLDWLFVAVFGWSIAGAAAATAFSQFVGGAYPIIYFLRRNNSLLRLGKFKFDGKALAKSCTNGSSELMSSISSSVVSMLYNVQLMKYAGENGIAAYGVLMYVSMIFQAIFIGYAVGTAPITSFNFGAKNKAELKSLLRKSGGIIGVCAIVMFLSGELLSAPLSRLFVGYDAELFKITNHAFSIFSFSFLLSGFSVFGSSFFTALNDGLTSAVISFMRTLVFQIAAVILFPIIWDIDGIWLSIVWAEIMSIVVTLFFLLIKRRKYGY